jgi:SAM-dependent methyltransferase
MDWRIKGLAQKALATVPGGRHINDLLQSSRFGGLRRLDAEVEIKVVNDWFVHVNHLHELRIPFAGRTVMEIGTGWYPTLPTCFALAGVASCVTFDLNPLLDWSKTQHMLAALRPLLKRIAAVAQVPYDDVHERWKRLSAAPDLNSFLAAAGIVYRAPADASSTELDAGSVDIVFSNSVLEHVEASAIGAMMIEARRVLRAGGVVIHSVNCGDHYAYFDREVTPIHYLRFTEAQWRWWNNNMQYQNRLRADDFVDMAARAGFEIMLNRQKPRTELLARLDEMPIAPEFRHYSREQLCTTSVDFVGRAPHARREDRQ